MEMLLETFSKDQSYSLCVGTLTQWNTLWYIGRISFECVFICFECTKHSKMNIHFSCVQRHVSDRICRVPTKSLFSLFATFFCIGHFLSLFPLNSHFLSLFFSKNAYFDPFLVTLKKIFLTVCQNIYQSCHFAVLP